MVDVLAKAVADRQQVPEDGFQLELEVDQETLYLDHETCVRERAGPGAPGRLHNLAREVFADEIIGALAGQVAAAIGTDPYADDPLGGDDAPGDAPNCSERLTWPTSGATRRPIRRCRRRWTGWAAADPPATPDRPVLRSGRHRLGRTAADRGGAGRPAPRPRWPDAGRRGPAGRGDGTAGRGRHPGPGPRGGHAPATDRLRRRGPGDRRRVESAGQRGRRAPGDPYRHRPARRRPAGRPPRRRGAAHHGRAGGGRPAVGVGPQTSWTRPRNSRRWRGGCSMRARRAGR